MQEIVFPGQTTNVISLSDFATFIAGRIALTGITNLATSCASNYTSTGDYYDADEVIEELNEYYGLTNSTGSFASGIAFIYFAFLMPLLNLIL